MAAKEAILDATEAVIDTVSETAETVERIPNLHLNGTTRKQQIVILTFTALVSAGVAGTAVYFLTKKKLETRYEKIIAEEVEKTRRYYSVLNKTGDLADPLTALEKYAGAVEELGYSATGGALKDATEPSTAERVERVDEAVDAVEEARERVEEIFGDGNGFDLEHEMETRNAAFPFVISKEEFLENEPEHEQMRLTYFEGDGALIDSKDQSVSDTDTSVGDDNLTRFGYGSGEKNLVYVRNMRLECDFEIQRDERTYAETLGFIEHSDDTRRGRRVVRMRSDDG